MLFVRSAVGVNCIWFLHTRAMTIEQSQSFLVVHAPRFSYAVKTAEVRVCCVKTAYHDLDVESRADLVLRNVTTSG
jgi:hypothetical protein